MRVGARTFLWLLVLIGAAAALKVATVRWQVEASNRAVELVLDWDEVRDLAGAGGLPVATSLRQFYQAGARGIAIGEETVGEMQQMRRLSLLPPDPPSTSLGVPAETRCRVTVEEPALRSRIREALSMKWNVAAQVSGNVLSVPLSWFEFAGLGIGFPPDVVSAVRAARLEPVLRVSNFPGANDTSIPWLALRLRQSSGRLIIFGGDQMLGYPDDLKTTAEAFNPRGLVFGQVEFGKQKGEEVLARDLKGSVVRVHSISPAEMSRMSPSEAVDRFLRAAQERNIRALYVRVLPGSPDPLVLSNVRYVNAIARALTQNGLRVGFAAPYAGYDSSALLRSLIGAGVAAVTILAVLYLVPVSPLLAALFGLLLVADLVLPAVGVGRKIVALQGALISPVLAFVWLRRMLPGRGLSVDRGLVAAALRSIPLFLATSIISGVGGLYVLGLLSSRLASVKILQFSGIKVQQAGAILIIAAILVLDVTPDGGWNALRTRSRDKIREMWQRPMVMGTVIVGLVAVVAFAVLLARSGNDPGVGVSTVEMRFRGMLERVLGVRPRTKEFLIGHPALLLGIALATLRQWRWALPLLLIGAIGQVSIVNTFCHLHTPLAVSVLRVANGLWTGALVGVLAAAVAQRLSSRRAPVPLAERVR